MRAQSSKARAPHSSPACCSVFSGAGQTLYFLTQWFLVRPPPHQHTLQEGRDWLSPKCLQIVIFLPNELLSLHSPNPDIMLKGSPRNVNFTDNERGEVACPRSPTSQDAVGARLKPVGLTPLLGLAAPLHPPPRTPPTAGCGRYKSYWTFIISAQPPISAPVSSMIPLVSTDTKTTPMRTHTHIHTCARVCLITLRRVLPVSAKLQPHKASLDAPLNTLVPCPQGREQGRDTVTSSFSPPRGRAAWPPSWGSRKPGDNNDAPRWSRKPQAWPRRPLSSGRRSAAPAGAGRPDPQEVCRPVTVSQTQA